MKALIVFYSLTGNTRKVSTILAEELKADVSEVTCKAYSGFAGSLRQGWDVLTGGAPPIEVPNAAHVGYDLIIAAGPTWGARPATPIRTFIRLWEPKGRALAVPLTCDGTSQKFPGEKALAEIVSEAPITPIAAHLFKRADLEDERLPQTIRNFAEEIRKPERVGAAA